MTTEYKILAADDSETVLMFIEHALTTHIDGVEFHSARNGIEAVEKAKLILPDIILMDHKMPLMMGLEAMKNLKEDIKTENIPVIMFTSENMIKEAFDSGAVDFIRKPFNEIELSARVKSALTLIDSVKQIEFQRDKIEKQRDLIAEKNKDLIDDINYASLIQKAILPDEAILSELLNEYFVLSLPRNIVSGDFYWIKSNENKILLAAADCTGHGVSGALMQMIGTVFLNEIFAQMCVPDANIFLDLLREKIIKALNQHNSSSPTKDGMDITFCIVDNENYKLQYAGANNPLYLMRNGDLTILKADRMPVGYHELHNNPFTKTDFDLEQGDILYLFTDGFADQFGGPRNKKFRYNRFQDLLTQIYTEPMAKQQELLLRNFVEWKGTNNQVDDILVIGYKIQ